MLRGAPPPDLVQEAAVVAPIRGRLGVVVVLLALGLTAVLALSLWITTTTSRRRSYTLAWAPTASSH